MSKAIFIKTKELNLTGRDFVEVINKDELLNINEYLYGENEYLLFETDHYLYSLHSEVVYYCRK